MSELTSSLHKHGILTDEIIKTRQLPVNYTSLPDKTGCEHSWGSLFTTERYRFVDYSSRCRKCSRTVVVGSLTHEEYKSKKLSSLEA